MPPRPEVVRYRLTQIRTFWRSHARPPTRSRFGPFDLHRLPAGLSSDRPRHFAHHRRRSSNSTRAGCAGFPPRGGKWPGSGFSQPSSALIKRFAKYSPRPSPSNTPVEPRIPIGQDDKIHLVIAQGLENLEHFGINAPRLRLRVVEIDFLKKFLEGGLRRQTNVLSASESFTIFFQCARSLPLLGMESFARGEELFIASRKAVCGGFGRQLHAVVTGARTSRIRLTHRLGRDKSGCHPHQKQKLEREA